MINTINNLKNSFAAYLQNAATAVGKVVNTQSINNTWNILAGTFGQFFLDLYASLQIVTNNNFPQNASGDKLDEWTYTLGLPARLGATYATVQVTFNSIASIPLDTIFTDTVTGLQYENLRAFTVDTFSQYTLYSVIAGSGYLAPTGNVLINGNLEATVQSSTDGEGEESDEHLINRILAAIRIPLAGARITDYITYALDSNAQQSANIITDVITIPAILQINSINVLGVFILIGSTLSEYNLNGGLVSGNPYVTYNRSATSEEVTITSNYIQNRRLVTASILTGTVQTYILPDTIEISTYLATGYSPNTLINVNSQDQYGNAIVITLTVNQLIWRETRRAIVNQQFGATNINGQNTITAESILNNLNAQLSANGGTIAQFLENIAVISGDIDVPSAYSDAIFNTPPTISYIYDIDGYNNTSINITYTNL